MQIDHTLATTNNGPDETDLLVAWACGYRDVPDAWIVFAALTRPGPITFRSVRVTAGEPIRPMRPYVTSSDGRGFLHDLEYTANGYLNADLGKLAQMIPGTMRRGALGEGLVEPLMVVLPQAPGYPPIPLGQTTRRVGLAKIRVIRPDPRALATPPRPRPRPHDLWLC